MLRVFILLHLLLVSATGVYATPRTGIGGLDTGLDGVEMLKRIEADPQWFGAASHPWLRIRGLPDPGNSANSAKVASEVTALARLKALGFKTICILQWDDSKTPGGIRPGGGKRLSLDLREANARAQAYGRTYGAVTAFEIDNEPDISFVEENAETYAAFLKACYLGFKTGAAQARAEAAPVARNWRARWSARWQRWRHAPTRADEPWVVMAPLALPPGPYLEQLTVNGFLGYTDAFNYHYYGYADDFSRTYRQFEDAVRTGAGRSDVAAGPVARAKRLPVLLTEYGYGSLDEFARGTSIGRVSQWRWFEAVGRQARELRIEGMMAFYFPAYLERGMDEFGLTVPAATDSQEPAGDGGGKARWSAGGMDFKPGDFRRASREGETLREENAERTNTPASPAAWMHDIGRKTGDAEATPALAWLLDEGRRTPYVARDWTVANPGTSPVVIDFVAKDGLVQLKRYNGYMARSGVTATQRAGAGEIVLYNFSPETQRGRLRLRQAEALRVDGVLTDEVIELAPGSRVALPVRIALEAKRFARADWALRFEPVEDGRAVARFATAFYAEASKMKETVLTRFEGSDADTRANRELLAQRPLALEEVPFHEHGRWRVTEGVTVTEEKEGLWRFSIAAFPKGTRRVSVAELPLPAGFRFPDGGMFRYFYRLAQPVETGAAKGRYFEPSFRTANGNLYQVWPRQYATADWTEYTEVKENYTMAFYNRANLPWRFSENRPVSLVFWFRPGTAPAEYEVRDGRIVRLGEWPDEE